MTSWEELVFWGTDGSINLNWWLVLSTKVSVAIISWNWINIWGTFYSPYWSCTIAWQKISNLIKSVFSPAQSPAVWAALSQLSLYLRDKQDGRCEMEPSQAKKERRPSLPLWGGALTTQLLQGAAAFSCSDQDFQKQHSQLTSARGLVLLMWMSGSLDWIPQGFRHRCMDFHMATQPSSDMNLCLSDREIRPEVLWAL